MWFKNLYVFKLEQHWAARSHEIEGVLSDHRFVSQSLSSVSTGWVPPREDDDRLVVSVQGQLLMAFRIEKKLLPSSVVNQAVKDRAKEIEEHQGYRPGRKQMKDLKEQIVDELLPMAFSVAKDIKVWIDPVNQFVVFDTASPSQADEITAALGKAMNPYPLEHIHLPQSLHMTAWTISGQPPVGFTIDDESQWENDDGVIRYLRHNVTGNEMQARFNERFLCTRLGMTWQDKISFVLTDSAVLKRVKPLDVIQQTHSDEQDESERRGSDFVLMTLELSAMLIDLFDSLED